MSQNALADLADGGSKDGYCIGRIEIKDGLEIVVVESAFRVQAAAFQYGVGGADGGGAPKGDPDFKLIVIGQIRSVNDVKDVAEVVLPELRNHLRGHGIDLLLDPASVFDPVSVREHLRYRRIVFVPIFP